jgi:FdhD protein
MRTPGDDLDLAIGFLFTEGLIGAAEDVLTAQLCAGTDEPNTYNVVGRDAARRTCRRPTPTPPATSTHQLLRGVRQGQHRRRAHQVPVRRSADPTTVAPRSPHADCPTGCAPRRRPSTAPVAARRRPVHRDRRAGLRREDVGRHNAVDKVVGWALRRGRVPSRATSCW